MWLFSQIMVDSVQVSDYPFLQQRIQYSPFTVEEAELYDEEFYFMVLTSQNDHAFLL